MTKPTYEELENRVKELEKREKSTLDAQQQWESLTQNSKAFIAIVDKKGFIHYINKATPPDTPEEIIGRSVYDFLEGDNLDIFKQTLKKVFMTGNAGSYEIQVNFINGSRWHKANVIPIKTENKVFRVILVSEDITEGKQAEDQKARLLHQVGERVKELHCLYGLSKLIEKPGISLEEIFQGTINLLPPSWQYPDITCARLNINGVEYQTKKCNCPDTVWKQTSDIKVHGKKAGILTVRYLEKKPELYEGPFLKEERDLIDSLAERLGRIIERFQGETDLNDVHVKLNGFMESATEGFVLYNSDLKLEMINEASLKMIHRKREDIIGKSLLKISPSLKGSERYDKYRMILKTGKPFSIEEKVVMPVIGERYYKINAFKVGSGLGFTFSDITKRKKAEETLRQYEHIVSSSNDMLALLDKR